MYTPFSQKFIWRNFKMHACPTCERAFNTTKLLKEHQKRCEIPISERRPHICPNCDKGFNNKRRLISHVKKCAFKNEETQKIARSECRYPLENLYCRYCEDNYVTKRQRDLDGHEKICPKRWASLTQKKPTSSPDQSIFTLKKRKRPFGTVQEPQKRPKIPIRVPKGLEEGYSTCMQLQKMGLWTMSSLDLVDIFYTCPLI